MKVHDTALKHGVVAEDAVHAAYWSHWIEPLEDDSWPHRELRLGFDTRARLLETIVLVFKNGEELIIHAMPARALVLDFASLTTCGESDAHRELCLLCRGEVADGPATPATGTVRTLSRAATHS